MSNSKIEARYSTEVVADLQILYRQATRRYGRAAELERRRRLVAYWERSGNRGETVKRYRESLADADAFIDRE